MRTVNIRKTVTLLGLVWMFAGTGLGAQTVLVGWGATYPDQAGNTRKSQLKNALLEGLLGDFFEKGWIAFDAPSEGILDAPGVIRTYREEALRNGASLGVYFHVEWTGDQETWRLKGVRYAVVDFLSGKVNGSGVLTYRDIILPSKEEEAQNKKAVDDLLGTLKPLY